MMLNLKKKQYLCRCDLSNHHRLVVNLTDKILSRLHLKRHQAEGDTQPLWAVTGKIAALVGIFVALFQVFAFFGLDRKEYEVNKLTAEAAYV